LIGTGCQRAGDEINDLTHIMGALLNATLPS
jgi:hypothetical protein